MMASLLIHMILILYYILAFGEIMRWCDANCSASPSLSGTHYGREHLCGAEGEKAVCQPSEAARGVFSRLPGVHRTHQRRRSRHRRVHSCCRSWTNARKDSGHCRKIGTVHRLSSTGRAESEDAAYSADILRKLRMTSLPATSSDNVNNGSKASGNSGKQ